MDRVDLRHFPLRKTRFPGLADQVHWLVLVLFLAQWGVVWARLWLAQPPTGVAHWPDGLLLVLATATTLCGLTRQLPAQNVILTAVLIALAGGAVHTVEALTAVPFGQFKFTDRIGQTLFHPLPWAMPLVWVVLVLNCRGVARLILRPWRQATNYGFWLLALTVLLLVLLEGSLEPYATQVKGYWSWETTEIQSNWYGAPWINFLGWAASALLLLAFVTPVLINKRPVALSADYHPLAVWALLQILFLTGAATHALWAAAAFTSAQLILVSLFALLAARKAAD